MKTDITQTICGEHHTGQAAKDRLRLALAAGRVGSWECRLELDEMAGMPDGTNKVARRFREHQTANFPGWKGKEGFASGEIILSQELEVILGLEPGEFDGKVETLFSRVYPADRKALIRSFKRAIRSKTDVELEIRFTRAGDAPGWLLVRGRLWKGGGGGSEVLLGVGIEITERKAAEVKARQLRARLEQNLASRTAQAQAINDELDAFYYSISHDLRAPLRSIRGFNEVLLDRYSGNLDSRGQEFLRRACESSHSMDCLINDLVKLSRVSRMEMARSSVNLSRLATSIAESLAAGEASRQARFEIQPGLQAGGDERLLRIVLENLLGNAWKFTSKRAEARIEFGFARDQQAFFVRDNGTGFEPSCAGRLFQLFQRLHARNEFDGTGAGLAIVQRIINRHGGRVWAEGVVDQGATFYLSLPNDEHI